MEGNDVMQLKMTVSRLHRLGKAKAGRPTHLEVIDWKSV